MIAFFVFWQPIGPELWRVTNTIGVVALYLIFAIGWGIVFVSTCMINHFDLFGVRQVWLAFQRSGLQGVEIPKTRLIQIRQASVVCWVG